MVHTHAMYTLTPCTNSHMYTHTYVHTHVYTHTCTHSYMYTLTHVHTHVYTFTLYTDRKYLVVTNIHCMYVGRDSILVGRKVGWRDPMSSCSRMNMATLGTMLRRHSAQRRSLQKGVWPQEMAVILGMTFHLWN